MKHIERDLCSDAWVMPLGAGGGTQGVKNNSEHGNAAYQIDGDDE